MRRRLVLLTAAMCCAGSVAVVAPTAAQAAGTHPVFECGAHPGELHSRAPVDGDRRNVGGRCTGG